MYMYIVEYYSVIKNELLPFATTWMELETDINTENKLMVAMGEEAGE